MYIYYETNKSITINKEKQETVKSDTPKNNQIMDNFNLYCIYLDGSDKVRKDPKKALQHLMLAADEVIDFSFYSHTKI